MGAVREVDEFCSKRVGGCDESSDGFHLVRRALPRVISHACLPRLLQNGQMVSKIAKAVRIIRLDWSSLLVPVRGQF